MAIAGKDIKLLWGRAAGRCSAPDCHDDLTPHLEKSGDIIVGEMAHNYGRKPGAARYQSRIGTDDTYDNLILLCPKHHALVDKAQADYPVELLRKWKTDWEDQVAGIDAQIVTRADLLREIAIRLAENERVHAEWGPTSVRAISSPQSFQAASTWQFRRLSVVIPNNRKILSLLRTNPKLLTVAEWRLATAFIEHAEFFEGHCGSPKDVAGYLTFPTDFAAMIDREVERAGL